MVQPIALFGSGIKSYSSFVTSQRRVNCLYDIREDEDKTKLSIRGTPGAFAAFILPAAPIRGWRVVGDYAYVVAGGFVFQVATNGTYVLLGPIANNGQYVALTDNSIQLTIVDGTQGYTVQLPAGAPALIVDPNFPNGCTSVDTLNSRTIAEVPGTRMYRLSAQLDGRVWSPIIFGTKENASDNLSQVSVYNGVAILWGFKNMEYWQDIGSSPNPLQRINGASQTWGLAAKLSRAELNNQVIFLGQNPQGGVQVLMINGYTPQRVSNSDIENIISSFANYSDAIALTYMLDGHPMYQLTFPDANRSFLYDANTKMWFETQSGLADNTRHFANLGIVFNAKNYVSDTSTGTGWRLSSTLYTDAQGPIRRMVTSRHVRMGGNEFAISEIRLEMDTGVGLVSGQGENPQIMMRYSIDGGKTFGPEIWKSLGRMGQYATEVVWDRIGSGRDFVFQFVLTDPVQFGITLGEAVLFPGTEINQ